MHQMFLDCALQSISPDLHPSVYPPSKSSGEISVATLIILNYYLPVPNLLTVMITFQILTILCVCWEFKNLLPSYSLRLQRDKRYQAQGTRGMLNGPGLIF